VNLQAMRHNWREVRCAFPSAAQKQTRRPSSAKLLVPTEELIPISLFLPYGSHLGPAKLHVGHSKEEKGS
jgi:hypothetical protein